MSMASTRLIRPRFSDLRLWIGVALLAVSMVAGATLLSRGGESVVVLRAVTDLSAGTQVIDVEPVAVPPSVAAAGYATPADIRGAGEVLRWPVPQGQLLPRAALAGAHADSRRLVTVPLDPIRAPAGLAAGDLVDVWATPEESSGSMAAVPGLVLSGVSVVDVSAEASVVSGDLAVVLDVDASEVGSLVGAARSGAIDLAAVPLTAQVAQ